MTHILTEPEMPKHNHVMKHGGTDTAIDAPDGVRRGARITNGEEETDFRGGGSSHNNMPPFVALNYCKKD